MQVISLQCPSVTYAQKGRRVLADAGIPCRVTHRSLFGCSYGLEVSSAEPFAILELLQANGVPCAELKKGS